MPKIKKKWYHALPLLLFVITVVVMWIYREDLIGRPTYWIIFGLVIIQIILQYVVMFHLDRLNHEYWKLWTQTHWDGTERRRDN